jgi:hypothetical protein
MTVTITVNGEVLDLSDVDFNSTPDDIMDQLVDKLGMEVDPDFNGCYQAIRQSN